MFAVLVGLVLFHSQVDAQVCRITGKLWPGSPGQTPVIDVYMNDTASNGLQLTGFSVAAVERALMLAISIWNEDAGANFRLIYRGRTPYVLGSGRIIVTGNNTTYMPETNIASADINPGPTYMDFVRITVFSRKIDGSFRSFTLDTDLTWEEPYDLLGILVHELGHALDFNHPENCSLSVASVMDDNYSTSAPHRVLSRWDKESIQDANWYGKKSQGRIAVRTLSEGPPAWGAFNTAMIKERNGAPYPSDRTPSLGGCLWLQCGIASIQGITA